MALRTSTQVMSEIRTVSGSGAVSGRLTRTSASTAPASAVMASLVVVKMRGAAKPELGVDSDMRRVVHGLGPWGPGPDTPLSDRDAFNTLNASLRSRNSGLLHNLAPAQNLRLHEVLHVGD